MTLSNQIGKLVLATTFSGPATDTKQGKKPVPVIYGDAAYPDVPSELPPVTVESTKHVTEELGECARISHANTMLQHTAPLIRASAIDEVNSCHPGPSISIGVQTLTRGVGMSYNPQTLKCECN